MTEIIDSFGRIEDFVRTMTVDKLIEFFKFSVIQGSWFSEMPVIEKYELTEEQDKFSSAVHIQRYFINLMEKLPLVAVTSTGASFFPLNAGFPFALEGRSKDIISTASEPYILTDGSILNLLVGGVSYQIEFLSEMFVDVGNVLIDELATVISMLLPFIHCRSEGGILVINDEYFRDITIVDGSAVAELGFTDGQVAELKMNRNSIISESLNLNIDIVTSDRNQRVELMDLVVSLFDFYIYDKYLGQWMSDKGYILFTGKCTRRGESEVVLQADPVSKLYLDGVTVPVISVLQIVRSSDIEDLNIQGIGNIYSIV